MDLNFKTLKKKIKITSNFKGIVGPKDLGVPAHFNIKPKAQAKEENVREWLRKAQNCWEASPRTVLSSANRCHGMKEQHTIQSNLPSHPKRKD